MTTIFFYGHTPDKFKEDKFRHVFSQWYVDNKGFNEGESVHDLSNVVVNPPLLEKLDNKFTTREQYMMFNKALLFAKEENTQINLQIAEEIMKSDPRRCKALGRKIKGFDPKIWDAYKYKIVVNGNYLQFSQNIVMKKILLETGNKEIVEASPFDNIWGIGLTETRAQIEPRSKWGENLLGKAIMEVRDLLRK